MKFGLNTVTSLGKGIYQVAKTHQPQILTGLAVAGVIGFGIALWKARPAIEQAIEDGRKDLEEVPADDVETQKEIKRTTAKRVIKAAAPVAIAAGVTLVSIIGAQVLNEKKQQALAAACTLSEGYLLDYKSEVSKLLGEEKKEEIDKKVAEERFEKSCDALGNDIVVCGGVGSDLIYEEWSDRYFYGSKDEIQEAKNKLNSDLATGKQTYFDMNDFYREIDIPSTGYGSVLGYSLGSGPMETAFDAFVAPNGRPALVLRYPTPPVIPFQNGTSGDGYWNNWQ